MNFSHGVLTLYQGKRLVIKDMIYYFVPPTGGIPSIAPSLLRKKRGVGTAKADIASAVNGNEGASFQDDAVEEPGNPTIMPKEMLARYHFTFLIRHPRYSIPSYFRCTVPPLDKITGFYDFMPSEAGYDELRRVFDYLRSIHQIGPEIATRRTQQPQANGHFASSKGEDDTDDVEICVVDADDLLDKPKGVVEAFCKSVGIEFDEDMLAWNSEEDQRLAREAFEKWPGFHDDALDSKDLKPRLHKKTPKSTETEDREWREKFGAEGAKIIRETVDANVEDYKYLKQFALKVGDP